MRTLLDSIEALDIEQGIARISSTARILRLYLLIVGQDPGFAHVKQCDTCYDYQRA